MKKSVKILSAVLCVFTALSFAACGTKNTESYSETTKNDDVVTQSGDDIILPEDGKIVFADKNKTENKDNNTDKGNNAKKDKNEKKDENKDDENNTAATTAKNNSSSSSEKSDSGSTTAKGGSTTKKNDTPASSGESGNDSNWGGIQWNN